METLIRQRVFSGIQPTGNIHLGNYIGAVKNWVKIQDDYDSIFCIVDLHAITIPQNPQTLRADIEKMTAVLLAAGIDPQCSNLFVQSDISAHAELAWILNCTTPMGWMKRMTQFKEKSEKVKSKVTVGLFSYPALMAADILLYNTDLVPVGEDQKQHLELTRDIAIKMNNEYGELFKVPEPLIPKVGARIMGLDDPTKKMSKSESAQGHAINILDTPEEITKKIKKATTDSLTEIRLDQGRPGIYNLLSIYQIFTGQSQEEIEEHFTGKMYGHLKVELAKIVVEGLRPIRERYEEIYSDKEALRKILKNGADKIRPNAEETLSRVKKTLGLGSS